MTTPLTPATAMVPGYTQPGTALAPLRAEINQTTTAVQTFVQERRIQKNAIREQNRQLTAELSSITTQNATAEQDHRADMAELAELVNGVRAAITESQSALQREIIILKKPIPPVPLDPRTKMRLRKNPPERDRLMTDYYTKLEQYNRDLELYNKSLLQVQNSQ
jgi:hypothetical protein